MRMKATSSGGNFDACPPGNHPAILIAIIDLGTQLETYQGVTKDAHKGFLCWEIPASAMEDKKPRVIGREYTMSLHEKAGLRKMIEAWRNKPLAEGEEFELQKLLGQVCLLNVVNEQKNDKTYAKIAGVSSLPKGMTKPVAEKKNMSFDLNEHELAKFPSDDWLPWSYGSQLIDIAKRSPEWQAKTSGKSVPDSQGSEADSKPAAPPNEEVPPF